MKHDNYKPIQDLLLRVVCRICEYSGKHSACDTIATLDHNSFTVRLDEVFIKQCLPNTMEEFSPTMSGDLLDRIAR